MYKGYKILALICARGGSQGIPNKNIKNIAGLPLISWTINIAKECQIIDKVVISTDSNEIAKVSMKYNATVPTLRPAELAGSKISKLPALQHMIAWYEKIGEDYDIIVDLDPTNPLRIEEDIINAVDTLIDHEDADSVISTFISHHNPYWTMFEEKNTYLRVCKNSEKEITCRQDQPIVLSISGNVVVSWKNSIMKKNSHSVYSKKCCGILIPKERSIDIDDMLEFKICEMILNDRKYK